MKRELLLGVGWVSVLGLGIVLRCAHATSSLWLDELHSAWCVTAGWQDVLPRAQIGNQSPLYFYLLRAAVATLGAGELALRLPSLIAGVLLIPVVGRLVSLWTQSPAAGLLTAALIAIDPHLVFYSQEARPYALLLLLAWCHAGIVWQLSVRPSTGLRIAFVAGAAVLFYLHYTAVLFCVAELCFLFLVRGRAGGYRVPQLSIDLLIIGLACAPAGSHALTVYAHRGDWSTFVPDPSWVGLVRLYRMDIYLFLPLAALLACLIVPSTRHRICEALASAGTSIPAGRAASALNLAGPRQFGPWLLVACLLIIPLVLAWMTTITGLARLFFRRYLLPSYVAGITGAGLGWALLPGRCVRSGLAAAMLITSLASFPGLRAALAGRGFPGARQQDWRGAVQFANNHRRGGPESAFVRSGYLEADLLRDPHEPLLEDYCLAPVRSLYLLALPAVALPTTDPARFELSVGQQLDELDSVWFLINGSESSRAQFEADLAAGWLASHHDRVVAARREYGEVLVLWIIRRRPTP